MRISKRITRHRVRTGAMFAAAVGLMASPARASRPRSWLRRRRLPPSRARPPARPAASLQLPNGGSNKPGTVRDHLDWHARRRGQARVADHPGEQVLRRDLHRAQPEQLPVADASPAGRPADQLLRHRPLQHGQLHLAGVRPVAVLRRAGRLLDDGEHDQQQQRDHHHGHGRHGHRHRRHHRRSAEPTPPRRIRPAASNGNYGQLLVHGGVDAALGNNGCVYPTDVATLFNQYNAAGVSWKAYAQDLGGAQPVGSTTLRDRLHPGRDRHRSRSRRRGVRLPGHVDRRPRHQPDQPGGPERRRDELHRRPAGQRQQQRRPGRPVRGQALPDRLVHVPDR